MTSTTVLLGRNTLQHSARGAGRGAEAIWYRQHDPKGRVISIDLIFRRIKSSTKLTLEPAKEAVPAAEQQQVAADIQALTAVEPQAKPEERGTAKPSGWGDLPRDVLDTIMGQLSRDDVKSARAVNKHWDATFSERLEGLRPAEPLQDADVPRLVNKYPYLRSLDLSRSFELTDSGVEVLTVMKQLRSLSLARCYRLSGNVLQTLAGLPHLQSLNLSWCYHVPTEGYAALPRLASLTSLSLAHSGASDAVLSWAANMPRLSALDLTGCMKVTDDGLRLLRGMRGLRKLDLSGCKVSVAAIKELRAVVGRHLSVYVYSKHNHHK